MNTKQWIRKRKHMAYLRAFITDIRWEIINTVISSSHTGFNQGTAEHLANLGLLVRKYERRRRLLRF